MKEISTTKLTLTYVGTFVGAGFVSGKELWQFFGAYGKIGILGLILSLCFQCFLGIVVISLASKTHISEFEKLIVKDKIIPLRVFFSVCELIFMYGVVIIMTAGAGALLNRITGLKASFGCLIFTIILTVCTFTGFNGMTKAFSFTVPILIISTLIVSLYALIKNKFVLDFSINESISPLLPNWFVAATTFTTNNLFCAMGVIVPIGSMVKNKNSVVQGVTWAIILLLILSLSVLMPLFAVANSYTYELPMLEVAFSLSKSIGYIYSFLLLLGMFGASFATLVAVVNFGQQKVEIFNKKRYLIILPLSLLSFLLSLFGFGSLISVVYPLCGYIGIFALTGVFIHSIKIKRKEKYFDRKINNKI